MDFPIHSITQSPQETETLGKEIGVSYIKQGISSLPRVIVCTGDLGSGKTTFVRGVAIGLGIDTRLLSPTYIIVRRYNITKLGESSFLYHLDLYRTNSSEDAKGVGIDEMLADTNSVVVIEWPDRLGNIKIDEPVLVVSCESEVDDTHQYSLTVQSTYENY